MARWLVAAAGGAALLLVVVVTGALLLSRPSAPPPATVPTASVEEQTVQATPVAVEEQRVQAAPVAVEEAESPFAHIADPPPPAPRRSGLTMHVVAAGDVLWQIAEQYQIRPETILWANEIPDADLLLVGQQLLIPPEDGVLYTVRPGDRLSDVAERYGIQLEAIVHANELPDADQVQAGTDLFLPGARPLAARGSGDSAPGAAGGGAIAGGVGGVAQPARGPDDQAAALAEPPVALPANIDALLSAGWLRTQQATALYKTADRTSTVLHPLPTGARLERLDGLRGGRLQVRDPGDGHTRQAMTGWVDAADLNPGQAPGSRELPLAYPADTAMDISHVFAPYRSQLDGMAYADANCGPTTIAMALEAFGVSMSGGRLRQQALDAQHIYGNHVGTLLTALAQVVQQQGLSVLGLYDGGGLHRWSLDDIRAQIGRGHPVVVQVRYRSLPGRANVFYFGDHYILVTGVVSQGFLYNDPMNVDGIGWDRVMSADRLRAAMNASDARYAYAAFAVAR